jgi:hypothetical protein
MNNLININTISNGIILWFLIILIPHYDNPCNCKNCISKWIVIFFLMNLKPHNDYPCNYST